MYYFSFSKLYFVNLKLLMSYPGSYYHKTLVGSTPVSGEDVVVGGNEGE